MPLMNAFLRRKKSAATVGRIVAGYGDLELLLAICVGIVLAGKRHPRPSHGVGQHRIHYEKIGLQLLYRTTGAEQRVTKARQVCKTAFANAGLKDEFQETFGAMNRCRVYRNLFSHCLWGQSKKRGVFFVILEEHAKQPGLLTYQFRHATQKALEEIETYFWYTFQCLSFLIEAFAVKTRLYRSQMPSMPPAQPPLKAHSVLLPYKSPN